MNNKGTIHHLKPSQKDNAPALPIPACREFRSVQLSHLNSSTYNLFKKLKISNYTTRY